MQRGLALAGVIVLPGCTAPAEPPSWRVMPLQRYAPHDRLAGVNQPDGHGLHIFLEPDTSYPAHCRPRWLPDPARLFNGNGTTPFSSGLATRGEFFAAVARKDVTKALQHELEALCKQRAPDARWLWTEPPRSEAEVLPVQLPALEQGELLTNPVDELERVEALLRSQPGL